MVKDIPEELKGSRRDDYIIRHLIMGVKYYDKIIPKSIVDFITYFYTNSYMYGFTCIYDEIEVEDLVICVNGYTMEDRVYTNMFAYRKQKKESDN